jgi:hypothetical protein
MESYEDEKALTKGRMNARRPFAARRKEVVAGLGGAAAMARYGVGAAGTPGTATTTGSR